MAMVELRAVGFVLAVTAFAPAGAQTPALPLPGAQTPALPPGGAASLPSCVSETRLEVAVADEHAWLDDTDRTALSRAMSQRYPMLGRDGFAPAAILMWRKPGQPWLYVALAKNDRTPAAWCFTASFSASVFDITPALVRKYFFPGAART